MRQSSQPWIACYLESCIQVSRSASDRLLHDSLSREAVPRIPQAHRRHMVFRPFWDQVKKMQSGRRPADVSRPTRPVPRPARAARPAGGAPATQFNFRKSLKSWKLSKLSELSLSQVASRFFGAMFFLPPLVSAPAPQRPSAMPLARSEPRGSGGPVRPAAVSTLADAAGHGLEAFAAAGAGSVALTPTNQTERWERKRGQQEGDIAGRLCSRTDFRKDQWTLLLYVTGSMMYAIS